MPSHVRVRHKITLYLSNPINTLTHNILAAASLFVERGSQPDHQQGGKSLKTGDTAWTFAKAALWGTIWPPPPFPTFSSAPPSPAPSLASLTYFEPHLPSCSCLKWQWELVWYRKWKWKCLWQWYSWSSGKGDQGLASFCLLVSQTLLFSSGFNFQKNSIALKGNHHE